MTNTKLNKQTESPSVFKCAVAVIVIEFCVILIAWIATTAWERENCSGETPGSTGVILSAKQYKPTNPGGSVRDGSSWRSPLRPPSPSERSSQ
jgi:hypothetical protein